MNGQTTTTPGLRLATVALIALLAVQVVGIVQFLMQGFPAGYRVMSVVDMAALVLVPVAIWGVWKQLPWYGWAVLVLITWSATIDSWAWLTQKNSLGLIGLACNGVAFVLLMVLPADALRTVSLPVKIFFAAVALLTAYVAFWGLLFPIGTGLEWSFLASGFDDGMPFKVKITPLHARVIGSLYAAATVVCVLNVFSRSWREARLGTVMILLWTGILMVITGVHSDVFEWADTPVWFWFVAYLGYPIMAAWILKRQRGVVLDAEGPLLEAACRAYLAVQGTLLTLLAVVMLFKSSVIITHWPWKILPLLSHIYSGPMFTFGFCSLWAARCRTRAEVRIFLCATLTISICLLAASLKHRDRFDFHTASAWVWFTVLVGLGVANTLMLLWPTRKSNGL